MRFLIDECLSYSLVSVAHGRGHEAHHVAHLALAGTADAQLIPLILDGDFTLVTNNADDFRRLYQRMEMHSGLILMIGQFSRLVQQQVFREILSRHDCTDLTNKLLEATFEGGKLVSSVYDLPQRY